MKVIYSPKYNVDIGSHVFPTIKYDKIYKKLIEKGFKDRISFLEPITVKDSVVALAHTKEYIKKLRTGTLSSAEVLTLELPYSNDLVDASFLCVGGTAMCCREALQDGRSVHLGGGFHHAFSDHGEGFCVLNDIAVGIRCVQNSKMADKVMVIDCDLHQGNGTADIFKDDKSVFTFSIHEENNYPAIKPPSDLDIGLADGSGDSEYLMHLRTRLPKIIDEFKPDLVVYVAGADPYVYDQLGRLEITIEGLRERDRCIFNLGKEYNIPVAVVLAGGYAQKVEDTVQIHYNMVVEALNQ